MENKEIIYDHYKDTFILQRENEKTRNNLFVKITITLTLLVLLTIYPNNINDYLQKILISQYELDITFEKNVLELLVWFFLSYFTIKYYQINVNIEKNYKYIHNLEERLSAKYKLQIYREGKNYLELYPLFLDYTYIFYKYVFPTIYILIIGYKNIINITNQGIFNIMSLFVLSMSIILIIFNYSYILFNIKISRKEKDDE